MNRLLCQLSLVVALCASQGTSSIFTCRGQSVKLDADFSADAFIKVHECVEEAGVADVPLNKIPIGKIPCIGKCAARKLELLDENGMPHRENILAVGKLHLPEEVMEPLTTRVDKCLAPQRLKSIDNQDKKCLTYVPVFFCIYVALVEVCADK